MAARSRRGIASFLLPARSTYDDMLPMGARIWRRVILGLHLGFAILIALAVVAVLSDDEREGWARPVALGALGGIAVAYAVAGRLGMESDGRSRAEAYLATAYLVVLVLGIGVLARTVPGALFILFIAYSQVWFLVDGRRPGVVWTLLVFTASLVGLALHQAHAHEEIIRTVGDQLTGVVFSLLIGLWINILFDRSREQARLIEQLELAKAEVAALERERGAQAERERLARDVHDTLAQGYTSILMLTRTALAQLGTDPAAARERLELAEEVAQENLAQARALVAAQSAVELDGTSLREALAQLANRFTRETGIEVDLHLANGDGDLEEGGARPARSAATGPTTGPSGNGGSLGLRPADELVLLRAAQEALTNARRHASPSRVSLTLQVTRPGEATVRVVDDGTGFTVGTGTGTGLAGLRRRLEVAGGELSVTSAPGAGTQIVARVVSEQ